MEQTTSVRSDRNIWHPPLKVVYFDRSGHFGRSVEQNLFDEIVDPVPLFCILLTRKNNLTRGGLGRVRVTGRYRFIGHVEFPKFQTGIFC